MIDNYEKKKNNTFYLLLGLYFVIYFCAGILPANIVSLLKTLPSATEGGIGIIITINLIVGMLSMIFFGYYGDLLAEKLTRKKLFIITNLTWIVAYGVMSLSPNYYVYLMLVVIGAIGIGAFLPLGFSMIGDFYPAHERGTKFGLLQFCLGFGNGAGILIGGLIGWRIGFGLGFLLGISIILSYFFIGVDVDREIQTRNDDVHYDYKITIYKLTNLFKMKTISGIFFAVLFSGIAISTLANWGIFYLQNELDTSSIALMIYIIAGLGALPGAIIGGKFGDKFLHIMKYRGRIIVSFSGLVLGITFLLLFYSFISTSYLLVFFGFLGYFFFSFAIGNQFAIYSEVCGPRSKALANAMNGVMLNMGGIIGNIITSFLIQDGVLGLSFAISMVLIIWLCGTMFWIITFLYYPFEVLKCKEDLVEITLSQKIVKV